MSPSLPASSPSPPPLLLHARDRSRREACLKRRLDPSQSGPLHTEAMGQPGPLTRLAPATLWTRPLPPLPAPLSPPRGQLHQPILQTTLRLTLRQIQPLPLRLPAPTSPPCHLCHSSSPLTLPFSLMTFPDRIQRRRDVRNHIRKQARPVAGQLLLPEGRKSSG
jgi:hypothetical protein